MRPFASVPVATRTLLLILLVVFFAVTPCASTPLTFTVALANEVPFLSCQRVSKALFPAPSAVLAAAGAWNSSALSQVVVTQLRLGVDYSNSSSSSSAGLKGCCQSGLWCGSKGCFTQSFGTQFVNGDWLVGNADARPVVACYKPNPLAVPSPPKINRATYASGQLTLYGSNFGADEANVTDARVGTDVCRNAELCWGRQCRQCSNSNTCSVDSICLNDAGSSSAACYVMCSFSNDTACPCTTSCQTVGVQTYLGLAAINLCVPNDGTSSCKDVAKGGDVLTCREPRFSQPAGATGAASATVSLQLETGPAGFASLSTSGWCTASGGASACFDGDICTQDTCAPSGYCQYTPISGCGATTRGVRDRAAPFVYRTFYAPNQQTAQRAFASTLRSIGKRRAVTLMNDNSQSAVSENLPFTFTFFGNAVNKVWVNNDATLSLPPMADCSVINCILFASFANTIALWSGGRSTSASQPAPVPTAYVYAQHQGDGTNVTGIDADAFHVLYDGFVDPRSSYAETLSASIYADSSIRLRYHTVNYKSTPNLHGAFWGLWGARASRNGSLSSTFAPPSYLQYYKENVSYANVLANGGGNDVAFCYVPSNLGCPVDACVGPAKALLLRWSNDSFSPSCAAAQRPGGRARGAPPYRLRCVWGGGLASTDASYVPVTSATQRAAAGPGTYTSLLRCDVPTLAGVADGSILAVDITYTVDTAATELPEPVPGSKRSFGVAVGHNGELARVHLMVRYSATSGSGPSCGCNALSAYPNQRCDANMVCGVTKYPVVDCAGTPFGRAVVDDCGICAGGVTGRSVQLGGTCTGYDGGGNGPPPNSNPILHVLSNANSSYELEIILLAVIACTLSCSVLGVMFCLRRYLLWRMGMLAAQDDPSLLGGLAAVVHGGGGGGTTADAPVGLTVAERAMLPRRAFDASIRDECSDGLLGTRGTDAGAGGGDGLEKGHVAEHVVDAAHSTECSICLADFTEGAIVTVLPAPCSHLFHYECVSHWFETSTTCPLCKRSIRDILAAGAHAADVGAGAPSEPFAGTVAAAAAATPPTSPAPVPVPVPVPQPPPPPPPLLAPASNASPASTSEPRRTGFFAQLATALPSRSAAYQPTSRRETDTTSASPSTMAADP